MSFLRFEWAFIPHGADTSRTRGSPSDALCGMSLLIIFLMIISGSVFAIVYIVKHPGPPSPPSMHEQILGNVTQLLAEMSAYKELL